MRIPLKLQYILTKAKSNIANFEYITINIDGFTVSDYKTTYDFMQLNNMNDGFIPNTDLNMLLIYKPVCKQLNKYLSEGIK